jgi:HemY protein
MKVLLVILAILIVAIALLIGFQHDSGYIIIHFANNQIELAFWTALIGVLIAFIVLYIVVRILARLFNLGAYFRKRKKVRTAAHIKELTEDGLMDTVNGRYATANNQLEKAANLSRNKFIPKLFCAFNAHLAGNWAVRDTALSSVDTKNKAEQLSFQLARTQFLLASQEWEKALPALKNLHQQNSSHPHINFLLAKTCYHLQEWQQLNLLLPSLKKNKHLDEALLRQWQNICFLQRLHLAARQSTDMLMDTWKRADRQERDKVDAKRAYIEGLVSLNEHQRAKSELASLLKKNWDANLCQSYTAFPAEQAEELLPVVDKFCQQRPNEVACRLALGILCLKAKRFVRAKEILTAVVNEAPSQEALQALAGAHQAEGEWEQAAIHLQRALQIERH